MLKRRFPILWLCCVMLSRQLKSPRLSTLVSRSKVLKLRVSNETEKQKPSWELYTTYKKIKRQQRKLQIFVGWNYFVCFFTLVWIFSSTQINFTFEMKTQAHERGRNVMQKVKTSWWRRWVFSFNFSRITFLIIVFLVAAVANVVYAAVPEEGNLSSSSLRELAWVC